MSAETTTILGGPYGRDLDPEANLVRIAPATSRMMLTYHIADRPEPVTGHRPLLPHERESLAQLLENAKYHSGDVRVQVALGADAGEAERDFVKLSDIHRLVIEVIR